MNTLTKATIAGLVGSAEAMDGGEGLSIVLRP